MADDDRPVLSASPNRLRRQHAATSKVVFDGFYDYVCVFQIEELPVVYTFQGL